MGSASSITYQPPPQLPSVEAARAALIAQLYKSDGANVLPARSDTDQAGTFTDLLGPVLASSDQACRGYVSEACLVSAMESCRLCVDTTRLQDLLWALALAERDVVMSPSSRVQTTGKTPLDAVAEAVPLRRTRMGIDGGNELLLFHYPTLLSCLERAEDHDGRIASTEQPSPFVITLPISTSSVSDANDTREREAGLNRTPQGQTSSTDAPQASTCAQAHVARTPKPTADAEVDAHGRDTHAIRPRTPPPTLRLQLERLQCLLSSLGPMTARAMEEARAIVAACLRDDDLSVADAREDGQSCGGGVSDGGRRSSHRAGPNASTGSGDGPAVMAKSREDGRGETPAGGGHDYHADVDIWLAAKRGDVCALQAARTRDPSLDFAQVDAFGNTPLYYTCLCGHVEACQFVLECMGGPERVQPDEMLRNVTNALSPAIRCVLQGKEVPAGNGGDGGKLPDEVGRCQTGGGDGALLLAGFDIFAEDTEQAEREVDDDDVRVCGSEDRGDCVNAPGAAIADLTADVAGYTGPPEAAA